MKIISLQTLIDAHAESIEIFGGAPGIINLGSIEAALGRAEHLIHYENADIITVAAGIAAGICRAHGFADGNKRAALIALGVTLRLNGWYLDATEEDTTNAFNGLAANTMDETEFREWVRRHAFPEEDER